jgi:hypothetical protein
LEKYLEASQKYEKKFWRQIGNIGATSVLNTFTKGQPISNENWNSVPLFDFGDNLIEF